MSNRLERTGGEESIERINLECIEAENQAYLEYIRYQRIGWMVLKDGQLIRENRDAAQGDK